MGSSPRPSAAHSLRGSRLLRSVREETVRALGAEAVVARVEEGKPLWLAGSPARVFTVILRGLVQVQRRTATGELAVLGIFGPTESVGDAAAIQRTAYPAEAVAVTEVEVIRIPAELMLNTADRELELARALQNALLEHTRALVVKIDIMSAGSVAARLATLLLHLYERFGDESEEGVLEVPIPLSRTALARLVSARTETVIRALSAMQKRGLVRSTASGFAVLDRNQLASITRKR